MAARGSGTTLELRVLRSPHHVDRRSLTELAAIDTVDALHVACVGNHRSLIQMNDGKYVLARRADVVDGALGVWVSTSGADDEDEEADTEDTFQTLPFQGGRDDSPRLIILGFLRGRFTHGYTGRDYWVTDVEANDCGVRTVTIAPSPSGAISQGRAVRRTVEEFISAFLAADPTPTRSPTPAANRPPPTAGGGTLVVATIDVSRRPIAKALRLWPRWHITAPSLATPAAAALDDLADLLEPLMGRAVRGRTAVISALAKVDGKLSFEARRKSSLRTVVRDLGDDALTTAEVGALFRDHLYPGGTPGGTPAGTPRRPAAHPVGATRGDDDGEDLLGRLGSGDEGDATDSGDSDGDAPEAQRARPATRSVTPTRATRPQVVDEDSDEGAVEQPARRQRRGRQVIFPAEELRQLTPQGVAPLAVARLFFKVRELAEAASFVLPDDLDEPSERSAYEERAGSLSRLRGASRTPLVFVEISGVLSIAIPKHLKAGWEAADRYFWGCMPPSKFTKHSVPDAEPGKHWKSKSDQEFVGLCEDSALAEKDGPLRAGRLFCGCDACILLKFNECSMTSFVGRKLSQAAPLAKGASTQVPRMVALEEWADELKAHMLVAVNVAADQRGSEGSYWLAKLRTGAFELPANMLCCGQEFEAGWLVAEAQWYKLEKPSLRGYVLMAEKTLILVNAMVRIGNLKFSGSRSGPQQRQLRSGGMEFLGDDEHYTILENLHQC